MRCATQPTTRRVWRWPPPSSIDRITCGATNLAERSLVEERRAHEGDPTPARRALGDEARLRHAHNPSRRPEMKNYSCARVQCRHCGQPVSILSPQTYRLVRDRVEANLRTEGLNPREQAPIIRSYPETIAIAFHVHRETCSVIALQFDIDSEADGTEEDEPTVGRRNAPGPRLTQRESEIVSLLLAGITTDKQLASVLTLSRHTVRNHMQSLLGKHDTNCRAELVVALLRKDRAIVPRRRTNSRTDRRPDRKVGSGWAK